MKLPGQSSSSQLWNSLAGPWQNFPPYSGTGSLHLRMRSCRPLPQDTEQGLHELQTDQRPFTNKENFLLSRKHSNHFFRSYETMLPLMTQNKIRNHKFMEFHLHGHGVMRHSAVSWPSPAQGFPPLEGAGLSHVRVLWTAPWPHVAEHVLQFPHAPQLPSTAERKQQ